MITTAPADYRAVLPAGGRLIGLDVGTKTIGPALCDAGWSFASPAELIANGVDATDGMLEGVRRAIGADTLGYISVDGMIEATAQPREDLCAACFDGHYPIALPDDSAMSAAVRALAAQVDGENPDRHLVLHDSADAVHRP